MKAKLSFDPAAARHFKGEELLTVLEAQLQPARITVTEPVAG